MTIKKKMYLIITVLFLVFSGKNTSVSAYNLSSWDLVDRGKHLDWDGSSSYMKEWYAAVKTWNSYKPGIIRADTAWIIEDVDIKDYKKVNNTFAYTSSIGVIRFNTYHMDGFTSQERQKTITHEIGHALGLDENNGDSTSIMQQGRKPQINLNSDDKKGYDAAYKNY